jgi:hypothetical protein
MQVESGPDTQYENPLAGMGRPFDRRRIRSAENFFERRPNGVVEINGLVCAKSRRAGQFSCFLAGITGGSLFLCLRRGFTFLASIE